EARHRTSNRISALKLLATTVLAHPSGAARFAAEVRAMTRLKHSGIVEVYDAGVWVPSPGQAPVPYAALELVPGPSLKAVLADGRLDISIALELVEAIARAVHHAHQKDVIHRDLKPANILLQRSADRGQKSEKQGAAKSSSDLCPLTSGLCPKVT